ncbi:MAG: hypothetical protein O7E52_03165, partial [Candidatus Poribacteria bacterium]|nr:hypothetical protein [Candidatus Poribacteria bacterium]
LDLSSLADRARQQSLQQLFWLVRELKLIAPSQAKALLQNFSPKDLAQKMSESALPPIHHLFQYLIDLDFDNDFCRRVGECLDLSALSGQARQEGLQQMFWFMRDLRTIAPDLANHFEDTITPKGLVELFRDKRANAQSLNDFWRVCRSEFFQQVLAKFKLGEILEIFNRSKLANIGSLLEYRYYALKEIYPDFAQQYLPARLAEAAIADIGKFITRIQRVRDEGESLAQDALELFLRCDMTARVAKSDVEGIAELLYRAYTVDADFSRRLLELPGMPEAIEEGLKHSGIYGMQLLLHDLGEIATDAEIASDLLKRVGNVMRSMDLTNLMAVVEIGDLEYFLDNVLIYVDVELAREYSRKVDAQERGEKIGKATFEELSRFLWSLVHISGTDVRTLDEPLILERLHNEWSVNCGHCFYMLGVIATARPNPINHLNVPSVDKRQVSGELIEWLIQAINEEKPYLFALTLRGLRAWNEGWFREIVRQLQHEFQRNWQTQLQCLAILQSARSHALTEKSQIVLDECMMILKR